MDDLLKALAKRNRVTQEAVYGFLLITFLAFTLFIVTT